MESGHVLAWVHSTTREDVVSITRKEFLTIWETLNFPIKGIIKPKIFLTTGYVKGWGEILRSEKHYILSVIHQQLKNPDKTTYNFKQAKKGKYNKAWALVAYGPEKQFENVFFYNKKLNAFFPEKPDSTGIFRYINSLAKLRAKYPSSKEIRDILRKIFNVHRVPILAPLGGLFYFDSSKQQILENIIAIAKLSNIDYMLFPITPDNLQFYRKHIIFAYIRYFSIELNTAFSKWKSASQKRKSIVNKVTLISSFKHTFESMLPLFQKYGTEDDLIRVQHILDSFIISVNNFTLPTTGEDKHEDQNEDKGVDHFTRDFGKGTFLFSH